MQVGSEFYPNNFFCYCEIREGVKLCMLLTVAPWAYKDKKLVSLKISTDPLILAKFGPLIPKLCSDGGK